MWLVQSNEPSNNNTTLWSDPYSKYSKGVMNVRFGSVRLMGQVSFDML